MKKLATLAASSIMFAGSASAELSQAVYDAEYARVVAACSGDYSTCAQVLLQVRDLIVAQRGDLSDAQLAGIVGRVAAVLPNLPVEQRTAVGGALQQTSDSVQDITVRATAALVADAALTGTSLSNDVVAQLGSPG